MVIVVKFCEYSSCVKRIVECKVLYMSISLSYVFVLSRLFFFFFSILFYFFIFTFLSF